MTNLILFPYAGSLGLGYNQWLKQLRTKFEIHRMNYTELKPGIREYNCKSWEELADLLFVKIKPVVAQGDYVFYGHSMGSRAAYEMYRKILDNGLPLPKKMILSGSKILTIKTKDPNAMSEEEFREEYIELGGISDEVLACKELAELAFSELKKDASLLSQFCYSEAPMRCPVAIMNGDQDKYSSKEEWEALFGCKVDWSIYPGKHFYIYDKENETKILEEFISLA